MCCDHLQILWDNFRQSYDVVDSHLVSALYPSSSATIIGGQDGPIPHNFLLGLIILTYVGQLVSKGRFIVWGAKVKNLIKEGQIWRLVTSSFLHVDVVHILVNCYSEFSWSNCGEVKWTQENFFCSLHSFCNSGSTINYYLCKAPAVGASGAIFGLVGSFVVFVLRHKNLKMGGEQQSLFPISRAIAINMESYNLEHDISSIHHWKKYYHDLYKGLDFLDKLQTIFVAGHLFWLSTPFWKENDKSVQKKN